MSFNFCLFSCPSVVKSAAYKCIVHPIMEYTFPVLCNTMFTRARLLGSARIGSVRFGSVRFEKAQDSHEQK